MSLTIYKSNRLEILAGKFSEKISAEPLPPMSTEIVVVQSRGMARWLSLQIAEDLGVVANISCPFPNAFVQEIFKIFLPDVQGLFRKDLAAWQIMRLLPTLQNHPAFAPLRNYLAGEQELKRLQLAAHIADRFDQYAVFRPEMVRQWDAGKGDDWQALLWREVSSSFSGRHRATLHKMVLEKLHGNDPGLADLPERLTIFGVSTLPPYFLEIFEGLSRHIDVNFYLLNPCELYWGDIVSDREIARIVRHEERTGEELYLAKGNTLLAAAGQQGRDFFEMLQEAGGVEIDCFADPGRGTLLAAIQSDILHLEEASLTPGFQGRASVANDDRSVAVHSCHGPMREVEVLRDQVLALFDRHPDLSPRDILVMTPDIELYSPLIQAVFEAPVGNGQRLPYSIADRSRRREGRFIELFLAILGLANSRYGVGQVRDIIGKSPLRRKFGLADSDLELVDRWLLDTNIRWGIDRWTRKGQGLPPTSENTWSSGLDRLLLGYAMAGRGEKLFMDMLPYDDIEGGDTQTLGRFLDCVNTLFNHAGRLEKRYNLGGWAEVLEKLLVDLLEPDTMDLQEAELVRKSVAKLKEFEEAADFHEKLSVEVIRSHLAGVLEQDSSPFGFITGGITFCAMLPMRAVPFKVVCLLGLNDRDYPRPDKFSSFDKMARKPRRGDRSPRLDDRYIFLEALLSARQYFYISYVGQSITDDSTMQPSVLVSDLIEYAKRNFTSANGELEKRLVTCHPLQPFNVKYFAGDDVFFSYSRQNCEAARALVGRLTAVPPLVSNGLTPAPESPGVIEIGDVLRFFNHPVRFFCQRRLGIVLPGRNDVMEDKEPFEVDGLARYRLESLLLDRYVEGHDPDVFFPAIKAGGMLPHGNLGLTAFKQLVDVVRGCGRQVLDLRAGAASLPDLEINHALGDFRLQGRLNGIHENGMIGFKCSKIKGRDLLRHWLRHLFLNLAAGERYPRHSVLVGRDQSFAFAPVAYPEEALDYLLGLFRQGMNRPLPLFPASSYEFAAGITKGNDQKTALQKAHRQWVGNEFQEGSGEGVDDLYYSLCFREGPLFDEDFTKIALAVFGPVLENLEQVKA